MLFRRPLAIAPIGRFLGLLTLLFLGACSTSPPANPDNLCDVFDDKRRWYKAARASQDEWGTSIPVLMAFIHQESRFRAKAKPPRKKILWVIPGPRPSDAYGYSQALESTWSAYEKSAGRYGADRDKFADAVDFVGWYNHQSYKRNKIARDDAYRLYLAYHEGHGGYSRGTYKNKAWLVSVARKVADRSERFRRQLDSCESRYQKKRSWIPWV